MRFSSRVTQIGVLMVLVPGLMSSDYVAAGAPSYAAVGTSKNLLKCGAFTLSPGRLVTSASCLENAEVADLTVSFPGRNGTSVESLKSKDIKRISMDSKEPEYAYIDYEVSALKEGKSHGSVEVASVEAITNPGDPFLLTLAAGAMLGAYRVTAAPCYIAEVSPELVTMACYRSGAVALGAPILQRARDGYVQLLGMVAGIAERSVDPGYGYKSVGYEYVYLIPAYRMTREN